MELLDALADGLTHPDDAEGRQYGFKYGIITDIDDPQKLGRIRARVGAQSSSESTEWLDPLWPGSLECTCDLGQKIFVSFVDGDPNRGLFAAHPTGSTEQRAKEAFVLGTTYRTQEATLNRAWLQFINVDMVAFTTALSADPIMNVLCIVASTGAKTLLLGGIPVMAQALTLFEKQSDAYLSKKITGK